MSPLQTSVVLAGAREAHGVITGLRSRRRTVVISLPEAPRQTDPLLAHARLGNFDTEEAFEEWLKSHHPACVIDSSHSFDSEVSLMAHTVCTRCDVPYLRVLRKPWVAASRDRWSVFSSVRDAAESLPDTARVFSNTGWLSLQEYAGFRGQKVFLRQSHEVHGNAPFPFVQLVEGTPPFSQEHEERLFRRLAVTHLLCRNVGGVASMSKLLAARRLDLPVHMVSRSPPPKGAQVVETVAEALAWEANL